jgi:hypothetical protein
LVRYGFSLWHEGHRRLKTWDLRWDHSAPSAAACMLPTMSGTGTGALQCRQITPRKVGRSVSMVIIKPHTNTIQVSGIGQSYSKGSSQVQSHKNIGCGNERTHQELPEIPHNLLIQLLLADDIREAFQPTFCAHFPQETFLTGGKLPKNQEVRSKESWRRGGLVHRLRPALPVVRRQKSREKQ